MASRLCDTDMRALRYATIAPLLSNKDINALIGKFKEVFATKKDLDAQADRFMQVFVTKEDHEELKERMDTFEGTQKKILSAVESFASIKDKKTFEDAARDTQLSRHDGWIKHIAKETRIKLSH